MGKLPRELSSDPTIREQQLFEWYVYAESLAKMKGTELVYDELLTAGLSAEDAEEVISYSNRKAVAPIGSEGSWNIRMGALLALGGVVVTALTYAGAMYLGRGVVVIAHGAFVVGLIQFIAGIRQRHAYRMAVRELDQSG